MAKPEDIQNEELRAILTDAFADVRSGRASEAVHKVSDAMLLLIELKPEILKETFKMRAREIPKLMRWPALGANMKMESVVAGKPEIEFVKERFAVSEALTYYQYVIDEAMAKEV